jgi:hypothetical protein
MTIQACLPDHHFAMTAPRAIDLVSSVPRLVFNK